MAVLAAPLACAPVAGQVPTLPESPAGQRAAAVLATLASSDEASVRALVEEQMGAELRAMSMETHLRTFSQARASVGGAPVRSVEAPSPYEVALTLGAGGGGLRLEIRVEEAPPHRIHGIVMRPAGGPAGGGPAPSGPAPERLTPEQRREVVDSVAARVQALYVVPDTGRMIADHLRARQAAGAYDAVTETADLVETLTRDLQAVNGDGHLYLRVAGAGPSAGFAPSPEAVRRSNHGFARVERLEGNVGYLQLTSIPSGAEAQALAVHALRFLERTDALILDLRGVPGGSGAMAGFLVSHFTEPEVPQLRVFWSQTGETQVRRSLAEVPGPRRTEVPLYVLVDGGSASAAEDIPFVLQNLGRATIVGERTAGAGRNNQIVPAAHGIGVSVSISRVMDPESGREWERVGVSPDVAARSADALAAAHLHALRRLAATAEGARRAELEATAEYAAAAAAPLPVPAELASAVAGRYEGGRSVFLEEGRLHYRARDEAPALPLVLLADGRFASGPTTRIAFPRGPDGRVRLEISPAGLPPRSFERLP
jgi:hypothetical protein